MKSYEWNGHVIQVECKALAATFWLGAGLIVTTGERKFYPLLDGYGRNSATEFYLQEQNKVLHGVVQATGMAYLGFGVKYAVTIDGEQIASDRQVFKGWQLSCISGLVITVVLLLAILGGCGILSLWLDP